MADVVEKHVITGTTNEVVVQQVELVDVDERLLELFRKTEEGFAGAN